MPGRLLASEGHAGFGRRTDDKIARATALLHHRRMVGLTDQQLAIVMDTARGLPLEKRDTFLQRVSALLQSGARRITSEDVRRACERAAQGLMQTTAA